MRELRILAILLFTILVGAGANAQETPKKSEASQSGMNPVEIVYDHAGTNKDQSFEVNAKPGQIITLKVINTCLQLFDYGVRSFPRPQGESTPADTTPTCSQGPESEKRITIPHEAKNGGYIVDIKKINALPLVEFNPTSGAAVALNDVTLVITVPERKWDYEMAGAFTTSFLTDPKFGIQMRPESEMPNAAVKPFVVRDREAEDEARLGVGAFVHVFNTEWSVYAPAFTFGLGINEANKTTYFTGLTWRLEKAGAFTLGYNWGSVDRLPSGTDINKPVEANILSNLGSQVKGGIFFAWSYTFLNPSGRLEKPFQQVQDNTSKTPSGTGTTGSTTSTQTGGNSPGTSPSTPAAPGSSPMPPQDFKLTIVDCRTVRLQWKEIEGTGNYEVLRSTTSCNALQPLTTTTKPPFEDRQGVLPNTALFYAVRAIKDNIPSGSSKCESVATPACP